MSAQSFLEVIQYRARQHLLFLSHAINQMSRTDRMISPTDVRQVISTGEIVEDYLVVITAYIPESSQWDSEFKILDEVPAWVCTQCGEAYFEEQEVAEIQTLIRAVDTQARKLKHSV